MMPAIGEITVYHMSKGHDYGGSFEKIIEKKRFVKKFEILKEHSKGDLLIVGRKEVQVDISIWNSDKKLHKIIFRKKQYWSKSDYNKALKIFEKNWEK